MLHVRVLGENTIWDDDSGPVSGASRGVALVALLALHAGSPQLCQRIAGVFWPESADSQALTNLRRELHHLSRILGRDQSIVVVRWRDTETCFVDLRIFARERDAALAATAAGDDEGAAGTPPLPFASTAASSCPGWTTSGSWTPGSSWSGSVPACATSAVPLAPASEHSPEHSTRPGAGSSWSRWKRPGTAR